MAFCPRGRKSAPGSEQAAAKARELLARGKTPLLVGGTGLYFQALLRGIADIPPLDPAIGARLEARLDAEGAPALHAELRKADPVYAARIHPNDRQRIARALEVREGTGRPFSWWHENAMAAPLCRGPLLVLNADLAWLEPRLARRLDLMLAAGALEEAEKARALCDDPAAPCGKTNSRSRTGRTAATGKEILPQCYFTNRRVRISENKYVHLRDATGVAAQDVAAGRRQRAPADSAASGSGRLRRRLETRI